MTTCPADDLKEDAGDDEEHVEEGAAIAMRNHLAHCYSTNVFSLITTVKYSVFLETRKSSFRRSENRTVESSESQS